MAYTGTEIFNIAIAVLDELSDTGAIVDSQIKEYKNRAPYLLDAWQKEIGDSLQAIQEYENTDEDNENKWTLFALPADLKRIKDVIFINSDSQIRSISFKRFGDNDIYLYFTGVGTARMLYVPIPARITSLTQTLEVYGVPAISGAYYLAEHFALADQNSELAQRCKEKFRELKIDSIVKQSLQPVEIKDLYGISQIK